LDSSIDSSGSAFLLEFKSDYGTCLRGSLEVLVRAGCPSLIDEHCIEEDIELSRENSFGVNRAFKVESWAKSNGKWPSKLRAIREGCVNGNKSSTNSFAISWSFICAR
jgi:hypothetical protein